MRIQFGTQETRKAIQVRFAHNKFAAVREFLIIKLTW